jgi:hypothetical protein
MPFPFSSNLPLTVSPYYSRVTNLTANSETPYNYPLIAFTPGYALQASELNEIQETFYVQQSLTQGMFANWPLTGEVGKVGATLKYPMWNGAVPYDPNAVKFANGSVTVTKGWYLVTVGNGLKYWLYNQNDLSVAATTGQQIGFSLSFAFIPCSESQNAEGYVFTDNSAGYNNGNSCGAHRYKVTINNSLDVSTNPSRPIVELVTVGTTTVCQYLNNLKIG